MFLVILYKLIKIALTFLSPYGNIHISPNGDTQNKPKENKKMTFKQVKEHNQKINNKIEELNKKRNALANDETMSDDDFFVKHAEITKEIDSLLSQLKSSKDIDKEPEETKELIKSYKKHFSDLFADVCYICEGGEKNEKTISSIINNRHLSCTWCCRSI